MGPFYIVISSLNYTMIMDCNEATELAQLSDLADIEIGRREKRPMCNKCSRPLGVCWCKSVNGAKVITSCKVVVLQHPHEEKRCLRTSPILEALMPQENYLELKGKKFNPSRFPELREILRNRNSILLYPGDQAVDVGALPPVSATQAPYNIVILDGTWQQAKSIFYRNTYLRELKQVRLSGNHGSQYVIRTQPTEDALSTVEAAAIVLSTVERNWGIYSLLIDPLKLICQYQISHGAVKHHSKEFLISSGRYQKPLGKRTYKKLKKCAVRNDGDQNLLEPVSVALEEEKDLVDLPLNIGSQIDRAKGELGASGAKCWFHNEDDYSFVNKNSMVLNVGNAAADADEETSESDSTDEEMYYDVKEYKDSPKMSDICSVDLRR